MNVEIRFQNRDPNGNTYLTWRPQRATVKLRDVPAAVLQDVRIELRSKSTADGGAVVFSDIELAVGNDTIEIDLPPDGSPVEVWVAGKFQSASKSFGDVSIVAQKVDNGQLTGPTLARLPVMVRVRKNAESLTNSERDRFLLQWQFSMVRGLDGSQTYATCMEHKPTIRSM